MIFGPLNLFLPGETGIIWPSWQGREVADGGGSTYSALRAATGLLPLAEHTVPLLESVDLGEAHSSTPPPGSPRCLGSLAAYLRLCPGPEALNGAKRKTAGIWEAPPWPAVPSERVTPGGTSMEARKRLRASACSTGAPQPGARSILSPPTVVVRARAPAPSSAPRGHGGSPGARPPQFPRSGPAGAQEVARGLGPRPAPLPPALITCWLRGRAGEDGGREGERAGSPAPGRGR